MISAVVVEGAMSMSNIPQEYRFFDDTVDRQNFSWSGTYKHIQNHRRFANIHRSLPPDVVHVNSSTSWNLMEIHL